MLSVSWLYRILILGCNMAFSLFYLFLKTPWLLFILPVQNTMEYMGSAFSLNSQIRCVWSIRNISYFRVREGGRRRRRRKKERRRSLVVSISDSRLHLPAVWFQWCWRWSLPKPPDHQAKQMAVLAVTCLLRDLLWIVAIGRVCFCPFYLRIISSSLEFEESRHLSK